MSGVVALLHLDGAPVPPAELMPMVRLLERRGPDHTALWYGDAVGLGHTLLATTPELLFERQPFCHAACGCVISADVRLDNRAELLTALGLADRGATTGDAELIVRAYLAWGEECPAHLLGDFAFVLWDPRRQLLFCARDQFGMRPLYYHHTPGRLVAVASEPRAILAHPGVPHRINEPRIADYLVSEQEGIDHTATFFEEVYRLPPAHRLLADATGVRVKRYWSLEPGPELRLPSDAAYAEAFLEVFTRAVQARLRAPGPIVGSMLSGGMDSGAVVAVARALQAQAGAAPLPTFSAVGPDPEACVETRTIRVAQGMAGIDPHDVNYAELEPWLPDLADLLWQIDEPFDDHMNLPRAVYLAGKRHGVKVMLDGVAGDVVLSEGTFLARLLRGGRWWQAYREMVEQNRFYGGAYPAHQEFVRNLRLAFMPELLRRFRRTYFPPDRDKRMTQAMQRTLIHPDFAARVDLRGRLEQMDRQGTIGLHPSYTAERCHVLGLPFLYVGRDRYDRAASLLGMEPRDPFLDRRVVAFCMALPAQQKQARGYPKAILRRAVVGRLPDAVIARRGKQHLGWAFTQSLMERMGAQLRNAIAAHGDWLRTYLDMNRLHKTCADYFDRVDPDGADSVYAAALLGDWLARATTSLPRSPHESTPLTQLGDTIYA